MKRSISLLAIFCLIISLCACGNTADEHSKASDKGSVQQNVGGASTPDKGDSQVEEPSKTEELPNEDDVTDVEDVAAYWLEHISTAMPTADYKIESIAEQDGMTFTVKIEMCGTDAYMYMGTDIFPLEMVLSGKDMYLSDGQGGWYHCTDDNFTPDTVSSQAGISEDGLFTTYENFTYVNTEGSIDYIDAVCDGEEMRLGFDKNTGLLCSVAAEGQEVAIIPIERLSIGVSDLNVTQELDVESMSEAMANAVFATMINAMGGMDFGDEEGSDLPSDWQR